MTDTNKAVERFDLEQPDSHMGRAYMQEEPYGDYVTYADYSALSAQLEAANARIALARDDALVDAIEVADEWYRNSGKGTPAEEIQALRTQPTASVEPVTVQEAAKIVFPLKLLEQTFAIQYNANCPSPWLVRLCGRSAAIDLKRYGSGFTKAETNITNDACGFGKTIEAATDAAFSQQKALRAIAEAKP